MLRFKLLEAGLIAGAVSFSASYGYAEEFSARLSGFNEIGSIPTSVTVPAIPSVPSPALTVTTGYTGAVLSDGRGTVELDLDKKAGTIAYTLTYSNVGTTPPKTGTVLFAHIHLGKSHDSGGILVFFCTNVAFSGTGPTPPSCNTDSSGSGTVSGMWTYQNVQAIPGQNVQAGAGASGIGPAAFDALVDALESNTAYANIHTTSGTTPDTAFPGGEIRGQCHSEDREHREDR
ncbi:MAG: CHRD domain-containing protein [Alphaproteobacteria bacterium]|nr:CHRD domain-containing protein [Alphaproteobacteria bacterium]